MSRTTHSCTSSSIVRLVGLGFWVRNKGTHESHSSRTTHIVPSNKPMNSGPFGTKRRNELKGGTDKHSQSGDDVRKIPHLLVEQLGPESVGREESVVDGAIQIVDAQGS